ncbi:MAG: T9SS type A sorting domain-containing protein [Sphingobacteriales bacterium]|nr:MAG: T9SS type A sorting domain-containing protein [Sphingobacteriales bacterium]
MKTITPNYTNNADLLHNPAEVSYTSKLIAFLITALIFLSTSFAFAQGGNGNGNGNGNSNNGPCNTSQPRPITGNQTPCPGTIETYCIENDRGYTSFEWDVPRAHAGNPPTGWEIISGQGTSCVTVLVGEKPGTMKVKVNDPICGTKVATLPVHPGDAFHVAISGPDTVCLNEEQVFTASVSGGNGNGNGNGNNNGTFTYTWTAPADWMIVDGQGTNQITVIPGETEGEVSVSVDYTATSNGNGNGNNGNGVGGHNKGYCNNNDTAQKMVYQGTDCGNINPLPVKLMSFNAARAQSVVLLEWATASEKNNAVFEVERSRDGRTFEQIGKEAGNGNTNSVHKYSFRDGQPLADITYYRLKQIDFDGKFEYSPVRAVDGGARSLEPVKAYPNPTSGLIRVELPEGTADDATVTIVSVTGQTVFSGTARSISSNQQIDMGRFTSGMYILNINSNNQTQSLRISKL